MAGCLSEWLGEGVVNKHTSGNGGWNCLVTVSSHQCRYLDDTSFEDTVKFHAEKMAFFLTTLY